MRGHNRAGHECDAEPDERRTMVNIKIGELEEVECVSTSPTSCWGTGTPLFDPQRGGLEWWSARIVGGRRCHLGSCLTSSQRSH